jgi:cell division protein FtsN
MGQAKAFERGTRSPWTTALLVVTAVAAASVALGLTVVGPMLQRKWERPAPALALNSPAPAPPVETPRAEAEVQIKERVIPRPKPKPPAELMIPLTVPTLDEHPPGSGSQDTTQADGTSAHPSINATLSDGERGADGKRPRDSVGAEAVEGGDGTAVGARARDGQNSKARRRRLSPLEALPSLGSTLPRSPAPERGTAPGAGGTDSSPAAGSGEAGRTGQSYRVQVGRFAEEGDARRLRDELEGAGLSPRVVKTERDGVVLYRVQVGTFKMKENADRQVDQLKQQHYEPYIADDEP